MFAYLTFMFPSIVNSIHFSEKGRVPLIRSSIDIVQVMDSSSNDPLRNLIVENGHSM